MSHKTHEQINDEINALKTLKPTVREFTAFGDDNHAAIDAQLDVLEARLDHDDVYEIYGDPDDEDDDAPVDQYILDAAIQAVDWMTGLTAEAPSSGWA